LSFKTESTFGTTAAGNFEPLPFTSHSINLVKDRVAGTDIEQDRMPRVDRHGNKSVAGEIIADLRHAEFDELMQSALMSDNDFATGFTAGDGTTTVTNAATLGTTPTFLSIEDYAADIDQARLFTGCTVNSWSVSMAPNQMVTSTFSIVGKGVSVSQSQKTVNTSAGNAPYDSYSGSIKLGDKGSLGSNLALITSVDFTLNNSFSPTLVIGSAEASALEFGTAQLEGTVSAYFEDATFLNRFLNETESALQFAITDGSNTLTITMPRIKINSADVGVDGPTSRIVNMSFIGLRDNSDLSASATDSNTLIKIAKS
jgi:hypothetical protein